MLRRCRTLVATLYERHLFLTNTVSCGVLLATGDCVQQTIERREHAGRRHNWSRTGRMFAIGFAIGPLSHVWYTQLDRVLPSRSAWTVGKKIVLDQVMASPVMAFTFLVGMSSMEGHRLHVALAEFVDKFPLVYLADWCVWPIANALNFAFVPSKFRALYIYCVDMCWYTFNSYVKHRDTPITSVTPVQSLLETFETVSPRLRRVDHYDEQRVEDPDTTADILCVPGTVIRRDGVPWENQEKKHS